MTDEFPIDVISAIRCVMHELPGIAKVRDPNLGYATRGIEQIMANAAPLCAAYGVVFVPNILEAREEKLTINNRPWTDTYLKVRYTVYGPGGRQDFILVGPVLAIGRDNSDKGAAKALTQAFKQVLNQLFLIADKSTDTDGQTHEADADGPAQPTQEQLQWKEAMDGLTEIIKLIPEGMREACSAYIKERFGDPLKMSIDDIREADKIAAGWDGDPPPVPAAAPSGPPKPGEEPF